MGDSALEKRVEKLEDRTMEILQEIATFKPILETINENIKKLGENVIDKERIVKLEEKVDNIEKNLQKETIGKKAQLFEDIIKYIILAIVGGAIGYFIK